MSATTFSLQEKSAVEKYFGAPLEELDPATFDGILRKLRTKYHPDNFEQFENEAVKEMATEKFQAIEKIAAKIKARFKETGTGGQVQKTGFEGFMHPEAVFVGKRLKIEILTSNKDLKYHLFGTRYRWLQYGDSFNIPKTAAAIHIDEAHHGHRVGFRESIRMYLTFSEKDAVTDIVNWLFPLIEGQVNTLLVAGEPVAVKPESIEQAIKKETLLRIGPAPKE